MVDGHGRAITYVRLSLTDRCDLRCQYCMAEKMTFLPRKDVLTLEELSLIADALVQRGVRRIRLTGGEPLVRRDAIDLARRIGRHVRTGALDELTVTTNGTQLAHYADALADAGIRRINVSLDTRKADRFAAVTRGGNVDHVLAGIKAASAAGISIKINMVAMRGVNEDDVLDMLQWCDAHGHDLTLIETMPLGAVDHDRADRYIPLHEAIGPIRARYSIQPIGSRSGGPARYFSVEGLRVRLGLITPMSETFCDGCNRIRITCQGRIYMCLGQDDHIDLMHAMRTEGPDAIGPLLDMAVRMKPRAHDFTIAQHVPAPGVARHMSVTGG